VRTALESLLKQGRIIRGYLGIESNPRRLGQVDPETEGVVVTSVVPGSPAAQAQLQDGDVIRKFDGHDVKNFTALRSLVASAGPNKKVELEVVRDGKPMKVTTEIKEQPVDFQTTGRAPQSRQPQQPQQPQPPPGQSGEDDETNNPLASIHVGDLTPQLATQMDLPKNARGVVITDVDADSGLADLQKGDVIEEINHQPIGSVSDYNKLAGSLDPSQPQVLFVCRHRTRSFVVLRSR
jgi:serine protease Do